jgi:hypothetical protein
MLRRLLLLLVGLGAAAIAAVLWSGTAYASTPRHADAGGVPGALVGALPQPGTAPLPLPPLTPRVPAPHVPAPLAPIATHALPPVVSHTLAPLRQIVPPVALVLPGARPAPSTPHPASTTRAPASHAGTAVAINTHGASHRAPRAHALVPPPTRVTHRRAHATHSTAAIPMPLGVTDGPGATPRPASSSFFAVTPRDDVRAPDGWSHAALVAAREPAIVVLRDIARPG